MKETKSRFLQDAVDGTKVAAYNYLIQFHEFGHGYYRWVLPNRADQGCKAVDVENQVRAYLKLPLRAYDNDGVHDYK